MSRNRWREVKFLDGAVWSVYLRWTVMLEVDSQFNATEVSARCWHRENPGGAVGYASEQIGPFDDLNEVIHRVMVDAAVNGHEQLSFKL